MEAEVEGTDEALYLQCGQTTQRGCGRSGGRTNADLRQKDKRLYTDKSKTKERSAESSKSKQKSTHDKKPMTKITTIGAVSIDTGRQTAKSAKWSSRCRYSIQRSRR
jgi:hypothetical protein